MIKNSTSRIFIGIIIFLLLLLIGASIFGIKNYQEVKENKAAFDTEIQIKVAELKSVEQQYDNLLSENAANEEEVRAAKERISILLDSIEDIKPNIALVGKLRKSESYFKNQLKMLKAENELLKQENLILTNTKDSLSTELETSILTNDSISSSNKMLEMVVLKAQKLKISSSATKAVRIKDSNKVSEVTRAKKVTGIEICYDVTENDVAVKGPKELFIQLLAPDGQVIGGKYTIKENGKEFTFSKISKFRYENVAVTVCDFIEPIENQSFTEGTYTANIFDGTKLINTNKITLK